MITRRQFFTFLGASACLLLLHVVPAQAANITLDWSDASDNEQGFNIERKLSACGGSAAWVALATVPANVHTYVDTNVVQGSAYCYRVNAYNQYGVSGWSNTAGMTVPFFPPAPPTGLGVVANP